MNLQNITKKALLILSIVAVSAMYSCKDEKSDKEVDTMETTDNMDQTTPEATGDMALNPPHGEPGHRCEIPVGAPLNSDAETPQIQSTQQSPVINNQTSADPNVKLNPAHGEPGHRCEIPVGAPLE